jgi:hypothetical protein
MAFSDQPSPYITGRLILYPVSYGVSRLLAANLCLPVLISGSFGLAIARLRPAITQKIVIVAALLVGLNATFALGGAFRYSLRKCCPV